MSINQTSLFDITPAAGSLKKDAPYPTQEETLIGSTDEREGEFFQEVRAVLSKPDTFTLNRRKVKRSSDVAMLFKSIWNNEIDLRESMYAIFLDRQNIACGWMLVSMGGRSGTSIDPALLFQRAILCNCAALILAHNHPSGNLNPSESDLRLTSNLIQGGKFLDIPVIDHLIVTPSFAYRSMCDENDVDF